MAKCDRCRSEVNPLRRVTSGINTRTRSPVGCYCSTECRDLHAAEISAARVKCRVCPRMVARSGEPGRPPVYCSEECRRNYDAAVARGLRALSRGKKAIPALDGDSADAFVRHMRAIEAFDADLRLLATKVREEGAGQPMVRAINETRRLAARAYDTSQRRTRFVQEEEREERKAFGTDSARRARLAARAEALEESIAEFAARQKEKP